MTKLGGFRYPIPLKRAVRPLVLRVRYAGLRPEDVIVASYPRSGSTWLRFLIAESLTGHPVEWDAVNRIVPYVGGQRDAPPLLPGGGRVIKTHDPSAGPARRAILLVRDPRDVVVSEYRWFVRGGYDRDLPTFLDGFLDGRISIFGAWQDNTRYWLDSPPARTGQLHLTRFEDLRRDPGSSLRALLTFTGATVRDGAIEDAIAGNTLERSREKESRADRSDVKRHPTGEGFVGEAATDAWRSKLTQAEIERVEDATADLLERLDYRRDGG